MQAEARQPESFAVRSPPLFHIQNLITKTRGRRMAQTLSTVGLLMAGATSISNVVKDISAKKVVDHHELIASTFWIRLFAAITFILALGGRALMGTVPHFRSDGGELFGLDGLQIGPAPTY